MDQCLRLAILAVVLPTSFLTFLFFFACDGPGSQLFFASSSHFSFVSWLEHWPSTQSRIGPGVMRRACARQALQDDPNWHPLLLTSPFSSTNARGLFETYAYIGVLTPFSARLTIKSGI